MSLILEALKKSEANRRLGEAPDLATPFATPRKQRSPLPVLIVLIALASVGGWWFLRAPQTSEAPATKVAPAKPVAATVPAKPVAAPAAPPAADTRTDPSPDDLKFVAVGPASRQPTAPAAAMPNSRPAPAVRTEVAAGPKAAPAAAAPAVAPPAAAAPAKTAPPVAPVVSTAAPAGTPAPTAPSVVASGEGRKKSENEAPPPPPPPSAPPYNELSYATRKDLPALKLSMHVYAPDPAARFVILNNARLVEGEKQDDVIVREIRPDGVVLDFRGQPFFFPRDGL